MTFSRQILVGLAAGVLVSLGSLDLATAKQLGLRAGAAVLGLSAIAIAYVIEMKRRDGTLDTLYRHWIPGEAATSTTPRWSVIRNVLHWVD
jgi:hypothetical protein